MRLLHGLSFHALLSIAHEIPAWAGIPVLVLGVVYLVFGKRLFRILVVGAGAAIGFEVGHILVTHFHLHFNALWVEAPLAAFVGLVAWPLWQLALFLVGGVAFGIVSSQVVAAASNDSHMVLLAMGLGFVAGGVFAILLVKAMSVGLTSALGAFLVYVGGVATFGHLSSLVRRLPSMPFVSFAVFGVLMLIGIVIQLGQPDVEQSRKKQIEDAEDKSKAREEKDRQERYDRYLNG